MSFRQFLESEFVLSFIESVDNATNLTKAVDETRAFLTERFPGKEKEIAEALKRLTDAYFEELLNIPI